MFDTILVPLDGTTHDEAALPVAIDQRLRHNAHLVLLYTAIRPEACPSDQPLNTGWQPAFGAAPFVVDDCPECKAAERYLANVRRRFHLYRGVDLLVHIGDPVRQIVEEAARWPRPLVVMADLASDHQRQPGLENRTERVLKAAPCQVLLVTREPETPRCCIHEIREYSSSFTGMAG